MDVRIGCLLACALGLLTGCADGPFNCGGSWNPWLRKEWEKDERRGPTFHTQRKQLQELADSAPMQSAERQEVIGQEMLALSKRGQPAAAGIGSQGRGPAKCLHG